MNKKLKYLSSIPLYGTCILFVYLFILSLKDKISKKNFLKSIKNLKKGVDFFWPLQYNTKCADEVTKKVNIKRP